MTPRQFLYIGGVVLLALGIFGFIFPNPVDDTSVLHFDVWENFIHTILGVVAIGAAYFLARTARWWLTLLVGLGGIGTAILGFALSGREFPNIGGANLENPIDNVLHLVVGLWALGVVALTYRDMRSRPELIVEEVEKPEERKMRKAA